MLDVKMYQFSEIICVNIPINQFIEMQVPGLLKIRHIGQTTLGSAAIFGLFLGAGSLIHCGKSY
jgi:hypothetical protein